MLIFNKLLILTLYLTCSYAEDINLDLHIKNLERTIDITSQLVKINAKITLENVGKNQLKSFVYAFEPSVIDKLSYFGIRDANYRVLKKSDTSVPGYPHVKFYRVDLKDPINSASSVVLNVELVYTKSLLPYPTEIAQQENQLVKYHGNLYFYSPYHVASQKTNVILSTKSVESFTKVKPFTQSDNTINYGTFMNIEPFTEKELLVHYKNNSPFLSVKYVERTIEVSHWGNIAVEENVQIYHSGAKLKGSFSRYEYQQDPMSGVSSVRSYKTLLPAAATDVYYRDTNGNISTSNMKIKKDAVELDLRPRYPLFGGWKAHYTLGYNVPSYEYLFNSGDEYLLKMRIIDYIFDDMDVEEMITKIILPEGSTGFKLTTPYTVTRNPETLHYTYLDTKGRPVISFTKKNLVENHIQDFQLRYSFPRILMFQEPLLLVGFIYALFICVIIYVRLDFSIQKDPKEKEH